MKISQPAPLDLSFKINHRNWATAFSELHALLVYAEPGEVICVTGPFRAGKSTLVREVMRTICGKEGVDEFGVMPYVSVYAANSGQHGTFSTKAFAVRLLQAVRHPIFSAPVEDVDAIDIRTISRISEGEILPTLERALINRRTRYLIIDESQHVIYSKKASVAPHAVLDSWKCLAEQTKIVLVVVGTYPILSILSNSSHLLGRKSQIHLPRYLMRKDDVAEFCRILHAYDEVLLPKKDLNSLCDIAEFLYAGSLGCIGLLRKWLKSAHAFSMLESDCSFVKLLEKTCLSDKELRTIAAEIEEGERQLKSTLGEGIAQSLLQNTAEPAAVNSNSVGTKHRKPFQRKAARYLAGNRMEGAT